MSEPAIHECRICGSARLELAIDLGSQPWCNNFLEPGQVGQEPYYPLRVVHCQDCLTAQLDFTVEKEVMFGDHTYLSGITRSLSDHFRNVAEQVDERFLASRAEKSVLDIGSNDGTQLRHFKNLGYDVLGVESSKGTADLARAAGIDTITEFFNEQTVGRLGRQFDVINAAGVFFHLEELHSAAEGIRRALRPDGVFVVQFLYMKSIVENGAFDQIYHEHLLYYTLKTVEALLQRHGLETFDATLEAIHGGSVVAFVGHKGGRAPSERLRRMLAAEERDECNSLSTYRRFASRVAEMRDENVAYLQQLRDEGKRVLGMGAPVKGNTLLNYFDVGPSLVEFLVEKNELRDGLVSPGMHIPVILEKDVLEPPDVYYVLAWNFKREILANNRELIAGGTEFYFPIDPEVRR